MVEYNHAQSVLHQQFDHYLFYDHLTLSMFTMFVCLHYTQDNTEPVSGCLCVCLYVCLSSSLSHTQ